ncbi:FHA domain-containing protein [Desulfitobacterium hafniense]|nr:FHA domain-containing protein [Desulfitobacterium hafniense]
MKNRMCKWILIILILFIMPPNIAQAETETNVLQAYVTEQTMTVFTNAELLSDGLKCVISNQNAEIMEKGLLSDESALTKTTVLIDISTSMPNAIRGGVITTLKKLIEDKSANEEFRLTVFGEELSVLQNFSSDRYDLAIAIEKIKFDGTQSKIYDAIYNTIPHITQSNEKPIFHRTIVITDGVDDTVSGITKEELFLKLQNERYPVDVVAVSGGETAENKELAAIVRMSGGRYYSLNPNADVAALAQALRVSNYFYFEAKVPAALLDGTIRQVDIDDGVHNMSIDIKFPVFNAPNTNTSTTETEEKASAAEIHGASVAPEQTIPSFPNETAASKPITTLFGNYTIVIYIGAGVALLIVIAVILAVAVVRGKKKREALRSEPGIAVGYIDDNHGEKTEFVGDVNFVEAQYTIKLSNPNNPSKTWTLPITGDLLIGRAEHCSVRLDDRSVSREQCKIAVQGIGLVVIHLGSTNKTSLNGSNIVESSPLQSGDTLKFGREVLRIDYIQKLGSPPPKPELSRNSNSGKTESIF